MIVVWYLNLIVINKNSVVTVRYVNFYQVKLKYIVSVIEYFKSTKVKERSERSQRCDFLVSQIKAAWIA